MASPCSLGVSWFGVSSGEFLDQVDNNHMVNNDNDNNSNNSHSNNDKTNNTNNHTNSSFPAAQGWAMILEFSFWMLATQERRAVCTKGRDVISASWWHALARNSSLTINNCNNISPSRCILRPFLLPASVNKNTPLDRNKGGKASFQNAQAGAEEQFPRQWCRGKACGKGIFFVRRHVM